jgi:ankyrin repeat protein
LIHLIVSGASVIAIACTRNDANILKLLLESGANISEEDVNDNMAPPLVVAACYGHQEVLGLLLNRGCCPSKSVATCSGATALHVATSSLHARCVQQLLCGGADARQRDSASCSPLDLVTSHPWSKDATQRGDHKRLEEVRDLLRVNLGMLAVANI